MTRKDYGAIAKTIAANRAAILGRIGFKTSETEAHHDGYCEALDDVANGLVHILKADNPNFDAQRFLKACGMDAS